MFVPDNVRVPDPVFTIIPPLPLITPAKVVEVFSPPDVNVPAPSAIWPVPDAAIDPTVSVTPLTFNVPESPTTTGVLSDRDPFAVSVMVPAEIVVVPEYEFAPPSDNVPAPVFVRFFDDPAMMPP